MVRSSGRRVLLLFSEEEIKVSGWGRRGFRAVIELPPFRRTAHIESMDIRYEIAAFS
jgi:hypothetical protein